MIVVCLAIVATYTRVSLSNQFTHHNHLVPWALAVVEMHASPILDDCSRTNHSNQTQKDIRVSNNRPRADLGKINVHVVFRSIQRSDPPLRHGALVSLIVPWTNPDLRPGPICESSVSNPPFSRIYSRSLSLPRCSLSPSAPRPAPVHFAHKTHRSYHYSAEVPRQALYSSSSIPRGPSRSQWSPLTTSPSSQTKVAARARIPL